ncbi:MAG: TRAP transporter substrate-binding protein [Desulfobacterales bacterium]|jgi:TRAP-type C4-dicarboxylate transport system substrate-binding protein
MKKQIYFVTGLLILILAVAFLLPAETTAQSESTLHIKFSTWHPPMSREVKTVWIPMLEELKKRSDGRITYEMFAGGALGKGPEQYDIVAKGLSDMGYFTATWTPGRFPVSDVLSLAASIDGKDVSTDIGNALYEKQLKNEFPGVKMIELNGCIQSFLWTTKPIRTLDDVKGLRIRSPGGHQTNYIKALGAEPVFMPLGDVYLSMQTGTIDGLVTCPPLVLAFKLFEVAKQGTLATFGCVTEGVIMNQKSWDNTPDDLKPIIVEVCHNPFRTTGGLTRNVYKTMMKEIADKGVQLYQMPQEQQTQWFKLFQEETKKWVAELEAKGLPAKEAVIMYNEEAHNHDVFTAAFPEEWGK